MKTIKLSRGYIALVDDEDYERLSSYSWRAQPASHRPAAKIYAIRSVNYYQGDGRRSCKTVYMHKEILPSSKGLETDHKDGDGLNNQRNNLRVLTKKSNRQSRKSAATSASPYLGVSVDKKGRIRAHIKPDGKTISLGSFQTQEDAARAYNAAAQKHYGDHVLLNNV
ncbi:HNH endonuclease [Rhizobium sp. S152]|uniref:HNH endonuclease n=1 Tax=Rhizobium sp. S152 TaxID=3055038 RepID=UPI0025AA18E5|nr:HNH endonuclease [Rhizobium sp. S152]MDM9629552.1 HNH endonuclease [Rhizobium sp. S152]